MEDYDLSLPKETFVNIATLAVVRKVLTKLMSLQDLVTQMLGLKLDKPESIRLSEEWTNIPLNEDQIRYAALDAYASIQVYWAIFLGQDPMFDDYCPAAIEPGCKVNVYDSTGSTIIAIGIVAGQIGGNYREYRQTVTNYRAIIDVTDIVVPCAIIPIALSRNEINSAAQKCTITEHLEHPKRDLLVYKKNLRPYKTPSIPSSSSSSSTSPFSSSFSSSSSSASSSSSSSSSSSASSSSSSSSNTSSSNDYGWNIIDDVINVDDMSDEEYTQDDRLVIPTLVDKDANEEAEKKKDYIATLDDSILKRLNKPPSNIKGDHLHCFKNLGDSMKKKNGAHAIFMRGLSDCFFMVSKVDVECVEQTLRSQGMNESQISLQKKLFWKKRFLSHCRRTTGHDRVLQLSRFDKFIETFLLIKDAKTKELLIAPRTKLKIDATRLAIASGYYIDPPGVNMFRELGRDQLGRMKYACYRGTNALEVIFCFHQL